MKGVFNLRSVDKAVLLICSAVLFLSGLYLAGPWYIPIVSVTEQPIYKLLIHDNYIHAYGAIQLTVGAALCVVALSKSIPKGLLSFVVFMAFAVRLYSMLGVIIALDGKLIPPTYLPQIAITGILGVYWLYVKRESK